MNGSTDTNKKLAWKAASDAVQKYTQGQVDKWNSEIDTLLIFVCALHYVFPAIMVLTSWVSGWPLFSHLDCF